MRNPEALRDPEAVRDAAAVRDPAAVRNADAVRKMFSEISPRYDLLNHLLSAGRDHAWRRVAVEMLDPSPGDLILDLCGGTGDLTIESARRGARVICLDFAEPMLQRANRKFASTAGTPQADPGPRTILADALRLPFADRTFRGLTIGFGLRNLRTIEEGFDEIRRVLAPGGRACILEFSRPARQPFAGLYNFYLNRILPIVGDSISRREGPYGYLARTIGQFPPGEELASRMRERGFDDVRWRPLTGGIVAVHVARRRD